MTYPYAVKFNGKWYRPNEDVPETQTEEKPITANILLDESAIQPVISQVKEVQPESVFNEPAVEDEPKRRGRKHKE